MLSTTSGALCAQMRDHLVAPDGFHPAALEIVIAAVECGPDIGQLVNVTGHGILYELVRGASGFRHQSVQLRLHVGREMHFHGVRLLFLGYDTGGRGTSCCARGATLRRPYRRSPKNAGTNTGIAAWKATLRPASALPCDRARRPPSESRRPPAIRRRSSWPLRQTLARWRCDTPSRDTGNAP